VNDDRLQIRSGASVSAAMAGAGLALAPAAALGVFNVGLQANRWLAAHEAEAPGWRVELLRALGLSLRPDDALACLVHGLLWALPLFAVSLGAGWLTERVFLRLRGRPGDAALWVITGVFVLALPPAVPLWQAALGSAFAIVFGKEIFGGTGRNVVNPALAGLAFLYLAYPETATGDRIWIPVDGASGATALATAAGGVAGFETSGLRWRDAFLGLEPGAIGETSAAACLLGALLLLHLRLADWRILVGGVAGLIATVLALGALLPDAPLAQLPWHWHLVLGSFAFGLVFLATDPVTAAATRGGRWAYGLLIGFLVVTIRVANPAHREGMIFAVLLANLAAPLLDHAAIRVQGFRGRRRHGQP
jgi:Na+-transporting NADH:ubiquinone oxidoreductase subunit B